MTTIGQTAVLACLAAVLSGAAPVVNYVDLATPFERVAIETADRSETAQIAAIRAEINSDLPGIYPPGSATDRLIADALSDFAERKTDYDRVVAGFPMALNDAVAHFRNVFPEFKSPLPIYLYNSLGQRDGGADYLDPGNRHVMLFGADMIAKYHSDKSLEPFLQHELFHLEHQRFFSDCDQFWCTFWQEGLAVDAAATMTPDATDHQLMLDIPLPIRNKTDARWIKALCFVAAHFDDADETAIQNAFQMGGKPPKGLPERFGYYVGFRVAQETQRTLPQLTRLGDRAARPVVRTTLLKLIKDANASCALPAIDATITYHSPHPV